MAMLAKCWEYPPLRPHMPGSQQVKLGTGQRHSANTRAAQMVHLVQSSTLGAEKFKICSPANFVSATRHYFQPKTIQGKPVSKPGHNLTSIQNARWGGIYILKYWYWRCSVFRPHLQWPVQCVNETLKLTVETVRTAGQRDYVASS